MGLLTSKLGVGLLRLRIHKMRPILGFVSSLLAEKWPGDVVVQNARNNNASEAAIRQHGHLNAPFRGKGAPASLGIEA